MKIEEIKTQSFIITEAPSLDPITITFRDEGPARGGIVVECYGKAWSAFWGGMGSKTVREFVAECDPDYLANKLWRDTDKRTKAAQAYLLRIATAVHDALNMPSNVHPVAAPAMSIRDAMHHFGESDPYRAQVLAMGGHVGI